MGEIAVRVTPRSSRNRVVAEASGLRIWVTAAPTDGQANAAVCELLAKTLGVPKSRVAVVGGLTSRNKRLAVEGMTEAQILSRASGG